MLVSSQTSERSYVYQARRVSGHICVSSQANERSYMCIKPGEWVVIYVCVGVGYHIDPFYDFLIVFETTCSLTFIFIHHLFIFNRMTINQYTISASFSWKSRLTSINTSSKLWLTNLCVTVTTALVRTRRTIKTNRTTWK